MDLRELFSPAVQTVYIWRILLLMQKKSMIWVSRFSVSAMVLSLMMHQLGGKVWQGDRFVNNGKIEVTVDQSYCIYLVK